MDDTIHNHEVEMKKQGYDQLAKEADSALDHTLNALKKNTDMQQAVIGNMLTKVTSAYEGAYGKIEQIIKDSGLLVSEAFDKYINSVPDFSNKHPDSYQPDDTITGEDTSKIPGTNDNAQTEIDNSLNGDSENEPKLYTLSLNKSHLIVAVGKSAPLKATFSPKTPPDPQIKWTSDKPSVASVSNGNVKGVSAGNTVITAKAQGPYGTARCSVAVVSQKAISGLNNYLSNTGQTMTDEQKYNAVKKSVNAKDPSGAAQAEAKKILAKQWYDKLRDRPNGNKGIPTGTSALAKFFMEKSKTVNRNELQQLADILQIKTPGAANYESWGSSLKNNILNTFKSLNIKYAKGGIVDYGKYVPVNTLDGVMKSQGEWGLVAARRKELILNENLSTLLQRGLPQAVNTIEAFNRSYAKDLLKSSSIGSYEDNTVYEVNIKIEKMENDYDLNKLVTKIDSALTKNHLKDMRKLRG